MQPSLGEGKGHLHAAVAAADSQQRQLLFGRLLLLASLESPRPLSAPGGRREAMGIERRLRRFTVERSESEAAVFWRGRSGGGDRCFGVVQCGR